MTPETALRELRAMLHEGGFDDDAPRLQVLWSVLVRWVVRPVEGMDPDEDADMVAFEATLWLRPADKHGPGPRFSLDFTRQFMHYDAAGEYTEMEQILVQLDYPPHADFEAITPMDGDWGTATQFWGAPGPRSAAWVRRVENDPSFTTAHRHVPMRITFSQGLL